jgi:eukaryotic-like serine/threonine-protein kinase
MRDTLPGRLLEHYQIDALIARGAAGAVYRGRDTRCGREVAIKSISRTGASHYSGRSAARATVPRLHALRHPNIAAVHEAAQFGEHQYLIMELAPGRDLSCHVQPGTLLPAIVVLRISVQIAEALVHAHRHSVLHGDVKPANAIFDEKAGTVKMTDFYMSPESFGATGGAYIPGTPAYMAPERLCGGEAVPASDQFSLGVLLYRLLCGHLPFEGRTRPEIVWSMVNREHKPLPQRFPALTEGLDAVMHRALARQPNERYPNMEAMAERLLAACRAVDVPAHDLNGALSRSANSR